MRTGPTRKSSRALAVSLEKKGKKTGKRIWRVLSDEMMRAKRGKQEINVYQLNKLSKKLKGKIMVTSSKVLSFGDATEKIIVAAPCFSGKAKEKIINAKGEAITLAELVARDDKESNMVLVK